MITITIETDNAAFDDRGAEVARILGLIANYYRTYDENDGVTARDSNGNTVCRVKDDGPDSPE